MSSIPPMPMPVPEDDSAMTRWLAKPVVESYLLDDMEVPSTWTHHGEGSISFTEERCVSGRRSLRLSSPTRTGAPPPVEGRPFGSASARRSFPGEDWSTFNRLSFWVYPILPGFRVISLLVELHNGGTEVVPDRYGREGLDFFLLKPDRWNRVVWEIAHLPRDRVTALQFVYRLQGNEPEAADTVQFDFDRLELERVEADHYEGWDVAPGRIAFSHTGYAPGTPKIALASDLDAETFQLIDDEAGAPVFRAGVRTVSTPLGSYESLDFSDFNRVGVYRIKVGDRTTPPFRIHRDVWKETLWKTLNLFYCERCGTDVPGIHGVCHRDWQVAHGDRRIVINGGWHDAGDLSQGLINTSEAAAAMLGLAERLSDEDPDLSRRLVEEAKWGLDWILKTRFGDGHRCTWATMDFWTDGILGTPDDVTALAGSAPFDNLLAASAEAMAGRMLREEDPIRADHCLRAATEDWRFALTAAPEPNLEVAAAGLQASIELYRATGEQEYAARAFELAERVMACQQTTIPEWKIPLLGFYYTDPSRRRILHYSHRGHEGAPTVALAALCGLFPDHPDWMRWYAAVVLHSEYLKAAVRFTEPWGMIPAGIYRLDESEDATYRKQVKCGVELAEGVFLRRFPVWRDFRGNHGTVLSQALALSAAAHLRRDLGLIALCQRQIEWVVGRNPFAQSTMYGEGHDFAPQYTAMSGDMVGSLPVGIQTRGDHDEPYWPAANCYNYKEVWVHPSSRWLTLMRDLAGPAVLRGYVQPLYSKKVWFNEEGSNRFRTAMTESGNDEFLIRMAPGAYKANHGDRKRSLVLLPGGRYEVSFHEIREVEFSGRDEPDGSVTLAARARAERPIRLSVRAANLAIDGPHRDVEFPGGRRQTVEWKARRLTDDQPWIAVLVPDDDIADRKEVAGGFPACER